MQAKYFFFFFSSPVLTNWEQGAGFDVFGQDSKEKPPSRIPVKRGAGNTQEMPERRPAWLYLKQGKRKQKLLVPTQIKLKKNNNNSSDTYSLSLCKLQACNVKLIFLALPYCDVFGPRELDLNSPGARMIFPSTQSTNQFSAYHQKRWEFVWPFSADLIPFLPGNSDLKHFAVSLSQIA